MPVATISGLHTPQGSSTTSSFAAYDTPHSLFGTDLHVDNKSIQAHTSRSSSLMSTPVGQPSSDDLLTTSTMFNPLQKSLNRLCPMF